jgi:hypothetical protein
LGIPRPLLRKDGHWAFGAADASLSDEDMAAIEARLAGIEVIGERLPPDLLKVTYR